MLTGHLVVGGTAVNQNRDNVLFGLREIENDRTIRLAEVEGYLLAASNRFTRRVGNVEGDFVP